MGNGNWIYLIPTKWSYGPLLRTGFPGPHLVGFVRINESTTDQRTEHNFEPADLKLDHGKPSTG